MEARPRSRLHRHKSFAWITNTVVRPCPLVAVLTYLKDDLSTKSGFGRRGTIRCHRNPTEFRPHTVSKTAITTAVKRNAAWRLQKPLLSSTCRTTPLMQFSNKHNVLRSRPFPAIAKQSMKPQDDDLTRMWSRRQAG